MPQPTRFIHALLLKAVVLAWLAMFALLAVLQQRGVLSLHAARVFTGFLILAGVGVPFAAVAVFLHGRSKVESAAPVKGRCPRCGYLLTGQPGWPTARPGDPILCPECGQTARLPAPAGPRPDG